jgi:hypothetical protein
MLHGSQGSPHADQLFVPIFGKCLTLLHDNLTTFLSQCYDPIGMQGRVTTQGFLILFMLCFFIIYIYIFMFFYIYFHKREILQTLQIEQVLCSHYIKPLRKSFFREFFM